VVCLVNTCGAGAVTDAGGVYDLCTEHLTAGILLSSQCIGARVLEGSCDRLSVATFLEALGISTDRFRDRIVATRAGFTHGRPWVIGPGNVEIELVAPAAAAAHRQMPPVVKDDFGRMRGPTDESNWLVTGRVITGAHPDYDYQGPAVAARLVRDAGVDTFVCFTEYEPEYVTAGLTTPDGRAVR
jgi:hypothetical protein